MHFEVQATLPRTAFRTTLTKTHPACLARWMLLLAGGFLSLACASSASATATTEGNVLLSSDGGTTFFADDPFTTVNEGIPNAGNSINENQGTSQINFEGRPDTKGTATLTDDENVNFDIYVGLTSYGLLTINGGAELRDMNLIIGDSGEVPGSQILRRGTGYVRIENPGSLFNNDPSILPFPFYLTGDSPSINDRSDEAGAAEGFDLFVGRNGTGDLAISLGGRAEIQDAAIVGDMSGSVGTLTIDGVSSFLQSGGFETAAVDPNAINYMIVGRLGSGTMSITNGGQSLNSGAITTGSTSDVFAAVIGSDFAAIEPEAPGAGGQGTVIVDGTSSKWTVAGNLQVGGFHRNNQGVGPVVIEDLDGNEVTYLAGTGRGTLRVSNDALVSIVTPPLDANATDVPDRLDLLVGRFGSVELDGGRIELLGAFNSTDPNNPTQELTRGRLINDGIVSGHGRISVLQFRNRVFGEVRVSAAQKLRIDSTGVYTETDNIPMPAEQEYPLSNYGLVEVIGTETARAEIQFVRSPGAGPPTNELIRPFLNLPLLDLMTIPGNGRTGGEIVAQDSIMRFDSGIINRHKVTFTGGSNEVVGNFTNEGTVTVSGDNTTVVFVDEFINSGTLELAPNISLVTFIDNVTFGGSGSLNTTFGGRPTGQEISHIVSAEDIVLSGTLNASLFTSPGFPSFNPQDGDRFEIISSAADLIGNFVDTNIPCIGTLCFVGIPDYTLDAYFIQAFELPAAPSPDLNGDGLVDDIDYNIWKQNFGNMGVPGSVVGDTNGDGVVDAGDYTVWRNACCGPFPGAGSGAGLGLGSGAVPEPASCMLLASAGLLAVAFGRRRAS